MPSRKHVPLSVMMFSVYMVMGAWAISLATYLAAPIPEGGLGFSKSQVAWVYSASAFSALVGPLFLGLLSDRLFQSQRLLAVLQIIMAVLMLILASWCTQHHRDLLAGVAQPGSLVPYIFVIMVGYTFCNNLSNSLTNIIGYRNLIDPKREFGHVRLWGTVGWIVVNVLIQFLCGSVSAWPLYIAGIMGVLSGLASWYLPATPPKGSGKTLGEALGVPALGMFRDQGFASLIFVAFIMSAVQQFYSVYGNSFLKEIHVPFPTAVQTLAQVSEVIFMLVFPLSLAKFGMRTTLLVGITGWAIRNLIFATESPALVVGLGLPLHGMCYTFFFIVAGVYVDRHALPHLRASAQGIFVFATSGLGVLVGNHSAAAVLESTQTEQTADWSYFWMVPFWIVIAVWFVFVFMFREPKIHPLREQPMPLPVQPKPDPQFSNSV